MDLCCVALEREIIDVEFPPAVFYYYTRTNLSMAKVRAFGDSFTWGSDMGDTMRYFEWEATPMEWRQKNPFSNLYSRRTWQAKLAEHLGMEYKCYAKQGCSNQTIVRRFFKECPSFKPDDLIIVSFTWRNRYDFYNALTNEWETVRPTGTEDSRFFELYYKDIHSTLWDQVESLKAVNFITEYLKASGLNFIVTCIDDEIYRDPKCMSDPVVDSLTRLNEEHIKWFNGMGFHRWSGVNGYPISPMWHPLEEAHEAAFKYVLENWDINE